MAAESSYLLTLPQLISAKKKIGIVSASYDPSENSIVRDLFVSAELSPTQFRF